MPQVTPRLPNSSSGGARPQQNIDPETWEQITPLIQHPLGDDEVASLKSGLENALSEYVLHAHAALSAPVLNRRKDQFKALKRTLRSVLRLTEDLQVGDEGDFHTAYIEHNLSHPALDDGRQGKLIEFFDRTREYEDMVRAVETACEAGRKMALASPAGLQPTKIWNSWVRETAGAWHRHTEALIAARHDGLGVSNFVILISILQSTLASRYRQHEDGDSALPQAVTRALRDSHQRLEFTKPARDAKKQPTTGT